jgi:hypothetical protein
MGMVSQILMGMSVWYIPIFLGWLVVLTCFNNLEKYEFVNGKDYPIFCGK